MTEHVVKCWTNYFNAIERGEKNFDVRRDDRGYQKGDTLVLRKYEVGLGFLPDPKTQRGYHEIKRTITYVLTGGQFGIEPGYVVLALSGEVQP